MVPRLIRIYRIQWWSSLFFFDRKYTFWASLVQKIKIVSWRWNLAPRLIQIRKIQWCCSLFAFSSSKLRPKYLFGILMLPVYSPSSLLAEAWNQWFSCFVIEPLIYLTIGFFLLYCLPTLYKLYLIYLSID